jgi:tripartite-type tricarboxylate transporter receptor subunit TctC
MLAASARDSRRQNLTPNGQNRQMSLVRSIASCLAAAFAIAVLSAAARGQTYPEKPVTVIVPFAAGGGADVIARLLQEDIRKELGQPIVIDNRAGANGAIGSATAARAVPDGYTLMLTASSTFSLNPNLMKDIKYDQLRDFVPVAYVVRAPWMMVVNAKSGFRSVADIVQAAKADPGKLKFGHWQSSVLVAGEAFQRAAGVEFLKVPYKSVVEAVTDLLAQRIDVIFVDIQAVRGYIEAGTLRYLAASTANRVALYPNVPTLAESGYPSVVTDTSVLLFAPSKTPRPIIERWNAAMVKIISSSTVTREKLESIGHEPTTMTLPELDSFVRSELVRWAAMIKSFGIEKK